MPVLALPHRAPKASPPAAAAGCEEELVTGFALAIVVGVVFEAEEKPDLAAMGCDMARAGAACCA
jgi:hypothetical protein